jgi:hypothetical protein
MLGRYRRAGCGHFGCRLCGPGDTRRPKRSEQRRAYAALAASETPEEAEEHRQILRRRRLAELLTEEDGQL